MLTYVNDIKCFHQDNIFFYDYFAILHIFIRLVFIPRLKFIFYLRMNFRTAHNVTMRRNTREYLSLYTAPFASPWTRKHKSVPARSMARAVHTIHFPRFYGRNLCVATLFATPHLYVCEISFPIPMDTNLQIERRLRALAFTSDRLPDAYERWSFLTNFMIWIQRVSRCRCVKETRPYTSDLTTARRIKIGLRGR